MLLHQSQLLTAPSPTMHGDGPAPPGRLGPMPAMLPLPRLEAAPLHAAQGSLHSQACERPRVLRAQPGTASPGTLCGGRPPWPYMRASHRPDSRLQSDVCFITSPRARASSLTQGKDFWGSGARSCRNPSITPVPPSNGLGSRPGPAAAAPWLVLKPSFLGLFLL